MTHSLDTARRDRLAFATVREFSLLSTELSFKGEAIGMSSRHHTVIFVPHERAQFRKWRITSRQLGVVVGLALFLVVGGIASLALFLSSSVNRAELSRLADENERLRQLNQTFETRLGDLRGRLGDFEERTRKLAIVAGLQSLGGTGEGGIGGSITAASEGPGAGELAMVEERARDLDTQLGRVSDQLEKNLGLISATPAISPVRGLITSKFGYRRDPITGQPALHSGIDISAPPGKPVKSAAAGVVTQIQQFGPLGRAVFVAHGFGITTVYGHLSRTSVTPGQRIERGGVVGLVGNTGRSTGYHLHYEVQVHGKPVDPTAYILDSGSSLF